MEIDKVFILMVSLITDEPNQVLASFTTKEKAEDFIKVQKGIYFPYKSYEIVESDLS